MFKKIKQGNLHKGSITLVVALCMMVACTGCGKADSAYSKGIKYAKDGEYKKSAKEFQTAIEADDENVAYYIGYGMSLNYLDQFEEAEKVFADCLSKTGMEISKNHKMDLYYGRAVAAYGLEKYEDAISYSDKALSYAKGKNDKENISDTRKAAVQSYYYLGLSYMKVQKYDEAKEALKKYIAYAEKEKNASAYNQIVNCLVELKDYEEAEKYVELGLKEKDEKVNRLLEKNRVILCEKKGEFKQALYYAEKYLTEYPDDADMKKEVEFMKTR